MSCSSSAFLSVADPAIRNLSEGEKTSAFAVLQLPSPPGPTWTTPETIIRTVKPVTVSHKKLISNKRATRYVVNTIYILLCKTVYI